MNNNMIINMFVYAYLRDLLEIINKGVNGKN